MMLWLALALLAQPAQAEILVPNRTIRPQTVITADALDRSDTIAAGALQDLHEVVGLEARVTLYPGRPIRAADLGPAALIVRNQTIVLTFRSGPLTIQTAGRALDRGGAGDSVRAINLASKTTLYGTVAADGTLIVSTGP